MIKKQRYNSAAAALAILAVAALFGLWLARFISGPITRLRDAVTRVGEGNFKVEVDYLFSNFINRPCVKSICQHYTLNMFESVIP